jgi:hypothetical protein
VLDALGRLFGRGTRRSRSAAERAAAEREQLALDLVASPRNAEELLTRLRELGLEGISACRLTRNRTVMVSFRGGTLRVHEEYLGAPPKVLRAIVALVRARSRAQRDTARAVILSFPVARRAHDEGAGEQGGKGGRAGRAPERMRPEDALLARTLSEWHARYNTRHFGGALGPIPVRVSRRLKTRLGHYSVATADGETAEIVIGRRHIRRHGWAEALHTLLHEMVHQWQDESGLPVDHGRTFRAKAREVGIEPKARRRVGGALGAVIDVV